MRVQRHMWRDIARYSTIPCHPHYARRREQIGKRAPHHPLPLPCARDLGQWLGGRGVGAFRKQINPYAAVEFVTTMVTRCTSHVTRHTSHVTRHTSHVTRHTSHVTRHTSHVTRRTSHVTRHTSHVTRHTLHVLNSWLQIKRLSSTRNYRHLGDPHLPR